MSPKPQTIGPSETIETSRTIRIPDLSEQARQELVQAFPPELLQIEEATPSTLGESARDITTATAVLTIGLAALRVLAVWIARHTTREHTEVTVQTQKADGSIKTIIFRHSAASAQSEAGVLNKLAAVCNVEVESPEVEVRDHLKDALTGHSGDAADG